MPRQSQKPLPFFRKSEFNEDSWKNELTGLGVIGKDKRMASNIRAPLIMTQFGFESLYQGDFLARKIVLIPAQEMTREGIEIKPSETLSPEMIESVNNSMQSLLLWSNIRKALQWSRLYGGGVVVMIIEDGGESWEPVNIDTIKTIRGMYDLNRYQIFPHEYETDPTSPNFQGVKSYRIMTTSVAMAASTEQQTFAGTIFDRSRLMIFDGIDLPDRLRLENNSWGDSVLQAMYNELRNYHQGQDGAASLVSDFSQAVFKIKGLHSQVAANGGEVISKRMAVVNLVRSMIGATVIDSDGEEFERKATPVSGLSELMDRFERPVVAASEMPHTVLFGDSPSGLGATGDHEEKIWKDYLKSQQESRIRPELNIFFKYLSAASDSQLNGEPIVYEFNSLWQQSEKEEAEIRKIISEADKNNIQFGVYSPDEARTRYEGSEFSIDISLDENNQSTFNNVEDE